MTTPAVDADTRAEKERGGAIAEIERLTIALGAATQEAVAWRAVAHNRAVTEVVDARDQALDRERVLVAAVADVLWKATPFGETDDGDVAAYVVPKGCMHRLIGAAQANGVGVTVAFRQAEEAS